MEETGTCDTEFRAVGHFLNVDSVSGQNNVIEAAKSLLAFP